MRQDYYDLITRLYTDAFYVQILRWCQEHGIASSGHVMAEENLVELDDGQSIRITLSVGVATYAPGFKDYGELVAAADAALYRAKALGRNHQAGTDQCGRLYQQGGDLRPAVSHRERDPAPRCVRSPSP